MGWRADEIEHLLLGTDSLLLVLLAKMRSSIYAGFREGPLTLVNIVEVGG